MPFMRSESCSFIWQPKVVTWYCLGIARMLVRQLPANGSPRHGTKKPCLANSELFGVETAPSGPPSKTCTGPSCQIARAPVWTEPGITEFAVVVTAQSAPVEVSAVAAHGSVTGKDR